MREIRTMKINKTLVLLFTLLTVLCPDLIFAADQQTKQQLNPAPQKHGMISKPKVNLKRACGIDGGVENNLIKRKWAISNPVAIRKLEIPAISDNIKQVQQLFIGKEKLFGSFDTLHRYMMHNNKSRVNARLYCFEFKTAQQAKKWFNVIDKTKAKNKRKVIFSKPKKLAAIANNRIYLIEGYHIRNYEQLQFILTQLPNVHSILGPDKVFKTKSKK